METEQSLERLSITITEPGSSADRSARSRYAADSCVTMTTSVRIGENILVEGALPAGHSRPGEVLGPLPTCEREAPSLRVVVQQGLERARQCIRIARWHEHAGVAEHFGQ